MTHNMQLGNGYTVSASIITRTKDRLPFLLRAKKSITNQTFKDWEWIIVNDASEEQYIDKLNLAEEEKQKTIEIYNNQNLGLPKSSNIGITQAKGEYIVIHDDDDTWHAHFLEQAVSFLDTKAHYLGVATHTDVIYEKIDEESGAIQTISRQPENSFVKQIKIADLVCGNLFSPIAFLFRRSVWDKLGGFKENMPVLDDYDFNLRVLLEGDIGIIPNVLTYHHMREATHTNTHFNNTMTVGISSHYEMEAVYKNALLRHDLADKEHGLGMLLFLGDLSNNSRDQIGLKDVLKFLHKKIKTKLGLLRY